MQKEYVTEKQFINQVLLNKNKSNNVSTTQVKAFDSDLKKLNIKRREVTTKDIEINILYCGVCHSDLHKS